MWKSHVDVSISCGLVTPCRYEDGCVVIPGLTFDIIIGKETLYKLGIKLTYTGPASAAIAPPVTSSTDAQRIYHHDDLERVFPGLLDETRQPRTEVEFRLKDPTLVTAFKPYRVSRDKALRINVELEKQLSMGLIRHSESEFAAPIVTVSKPNGDIRICQDYRALNANTTQDPFPMPHIDSIIVSLGGCRWFSKIDLKSAF